MHTQNRSNMIKLNYVELTLSLIKTANPEWISIAHTAIMAASR